METNTVGTRVAALRQRAGLTPTELGRLAGLHQSHIGLIESGKRKKVTADTLDAIAKVLATTVDFLATGAGQEPSLRKLALAVEKARGLHAA